MKCFVSTINIYYVEQSDMGANAPASDQFIMDTGHNTIIIKLRQKQVIYFPWKKIISGRKIRRNLVCIRFMWV